MSATDDVAVALCENQEDASCSSSGQLEDADRNANVSVSRGAIPKQTKSKLSSSLHKKLNNNNESLQNGITNVFSQIPTCLVCENNSGNNLCNCILKQPSASCLKNDICDNSSSDENELLSISDDGCIYTYKADDSADLPSSFYNLSVAVENPEVLPPQRENLSPEMDFLEMDFDPGPSGSGDTDSDSFFNAEGEETDHLFQEPACNKAITEVAIANIVKEKCDEPPKCAIVKPIPVEKCEETSIKKKNLVTTTSTSTQHDKKNKAMPWSCLFRQRTCNNKYQGCNHSYRGELSYDTYSFDKRPEQVMVWSEEEACRVQVHQIAASSCGATAALNVLKALRLPIPTIETMQSTFKTRFRANDSPLAEYLLSRSVAGSTHEDIINGLRKLSNGKIYSRFFHMYPERVLNLSWWLQYWISQGAVPIATLNLQKSVGIRMPDAWHHQMIFGVGPCGVYLTNPLECVKPEVLWPQLTSESVLLIRREDVLTRWRISPSLNQLMGIRNQKWTSMNVVGQVANLVRESARDARPGFTTTSHIKIPASYSAGITISLLKDSSAYMLLKKCPELPFIPSRGQVSITDLF